MNKFQQDENIIDRNEADSLVREIRRMGIKDKRVLSAIMNVPRSYFVRNTYIDNAYINYPLPIGYGQTISQPYTVAFMLEKLELGKGDKVMEIGSGSGYNAALMASIVGPSGHIYSIEIISALAIFARENIVRAGITNTEIINTDGNNG